MLVIALERWRQERLVLIRLSGVSLLLFGVLTCFGLGAGPCQLGFLRDQGSSRSGRALLCAVTRRRPRSSRAGSCWIRSKGCARADRAVRPWSRQARRESAGPGRSLRRRADQDAAEGETPRRRDCRPGTMGQGGSRGAIGPVRPRCAAAAGLEAAWIDLATARKHWAYQPIKRHEPPPVKNRSWPRMPIDPFVLARLEASGLTPSPPADRRTLLRRAYYDLIGLPPTARGDRGLRTRPIRRCLCPRR